MVRTKLRSALMVTVLSCIHLGCANWFVAPDTTPTPTPTPRSEPASNTPAPSSDKLEPPQMSVSAPPAEGTPTDLRGRLNQAVRVAREAARTEGSDAATKLLEMDLRDCAYALEDCLTFVRATSSSETETLPNKVVLLANAVTTLERKLRPPLSRQLNLGMESYVLVAELAATNARKFSADLVVRRAEIQALKKKAEEEDASLDPVRKECAASPAACKTKCDGGAGLFCAARAEALNAAGKFSDASAPATKGCGHGVQTACLIAKNVEAHQQQTRAKLDGAWQEVQNIADDLARKRHQTETVAKLANRPHLQVSVQRMRTINAAIVTEKLCPAKKAFLAQGGQAEYQKRAAAHCKDDPPEGTGLSGAAVPLNAQCAAAYASACP